MGKDPDTIWPLRDGTSQTARQAPMLDPKTVPVDGRSITQLTDFIKAYAKHLNFFDEENQPVGDWTGLLQGMTSDQFAALAQALDDQSMPLDGQPLRPHVALVLTFLKLFRQVQSRVDGISARHLEYYFNDVLGLTPRLPRADSAHVVIELAPKQTAYDLPAQTRVHAGTDDTGADVYFSTDEHLLVNTAQIAKLMYVRVDYDVTPQITAQPEVRAEYTPKALLMSAYDKPSNDIDPAASMVRYALGDPEPGDPLPERRYYKDLDAATDQQYASDKLFINPANFSLLLSILKVDTPPAVDPNKMEQAHNILEQAMRRKRGIKTDFFQNRVWRNLYAAEDASANVSPAPAPDSKNTHNWPMFGSADADALAQVAQPAKIGFSVASPLLVLTEGARTIALTIGFDPDFCDMQQIEAALTDADPQKAPFNIYVVSGTDKIDVTEKAVLSVTIKTTDMVVTLKLGADDPALQGTASASGALTDWPKLQLELRDIAGDTSTRLEKLYPVFRLLQIKTATLAVSVEGLAALTLQNDDGSIDAKKPFEPFGLAPVKGSRLSVGHPDLVDKTVTSVGFQLEWMGAPKSFKDYYVNYPVFAETDPSFKATFKVGGRGINTASESKPLFATPPTEVNTIEWQRDDGKPVFTGKSTDTAKGDLLSWDRYVTIDLDEPDFQHAAYPVVAADLARKMAVKQIDGTITEEDLAKYAINPPYTPRLRSLTLSFKASTDLLSGPNTLSHIHPFGQVKISLKQPDSEGGQSNLYPFLPDYHNEGEFYIGLEGVLAPQSLSLLLQLAEGSAHSSPLLDPANVAWSYLSGDKWTDFGDGDLIVDKTDGLIRSGIVRFNLPLAEPSTLLPQVLYWLRACVIRNTEAVSNAIAILAQAVTVTREMPTNPDAGVTLPLAAKSISKLVQTRPEIASIKQPFASFGGRGAERPDTFNTRVSERLRHKNRALTIWDYERLILDRFAQVYKAKCVPASTGAGLKIVILPDMRGKIPFDPFAPTAPMSLLADITDFLTPRISPLAADGLSVTNATFVPVLLRFAVRLNAMGNGDPGFYTNLLNDEINRFLSPWAYDDTADIVFDARIFGNDIVNFIERRPYVDYCAELKLFTLDAQGTPLPAQPDPAGYSVCATGRDEVLVAAHQHEINIIDDNADQIFAGIGYMKIGLDFKVADEPSSEI